MFRCAKVPLCFCDSEENFKNSRLLFLFSERGERVKKGSGSKETKIWFALTANFFIFSQNTSQVIIYEITRTKQRHKRLREVMLPAQAQTLRVFSDGRLCVGYQSGFSLYSIAGDHCPICKFN